MGRRAKRTGGVTFDSAYLEGYDDIFSVPEDVLNKAMSEFLNSYAIIDESDIQADQETRVYVAQYLLQEFADRDAYSRANGLTQNSKYTKNLDLTAGSGATEQGAKIAANRLIDLVAIEFNHARIGSWASSGKSIYSTAKIFKTKSDYGIALDIKFSDDALKRNSLLRVKWDKTSHKYVPSKERVGGQGVDGSRTDQLDNVFKLFINGNEADVHPVFGFWEDRRNKFVYYKNNRKANDFLSKAIEKFHEEYPGVRILLRNSSEYNPGISSLQFWE